MIFLIKTSINKLRFRFHINFPGCILWTLETQVRKNKWTSRNEKIWSVRHGICNFISSFKLAQKHKLYSNDLYGSMLLVFVRCIPVDPISPKPWTWLSAPAMKDGNHSMRLYFCVFLDIIWNPCMFIHCHDIWSYYNRMVTLCNDITSVLQQRIMK